MNVNIVHLAGRCTRDPAIKFLPDQTPVCEVGLAINEKRKEKESTHFVDLVAFGKTAELIGEHFHKGKPIFVSGRLRYDSWESDGGKRSKLVVVVNDFQFVGSKSENGDGQQEREPYPRTRESVTKREVPNPIGNEKQLEDSEIPFDSARSGRRA